MKNNFYVKCGALFLCMAMIFSLSGCGNDSTQKFYDAVYESQELMDTVADKIYSNWYDAIYEDKFSDDINIAISTAIKDNSDNITKINELDAGIAEYFKAAKESKCGDKVKAVMSAYTDYYEFVINVSGSFNSYSESKEKLKKELSSALKELSFEL